MPHVHGELFNTTATAVLLPFIPTAWGTLFSGNHGISFGTRFIPTAWGDSKFLISMSRIRSVHPPRAWELAICLFMVNALLGHPHVHGELNFPYFYISQPRFSHVHGELTGLQGISRSRPFIPTCMGTPGCGTPCPEAVGSSTCMGNSPLQMRTPIGSVIPRCMGNSRKRAELTATFRFIPRA